MGASRAGRVVVVAELLKAGAYREAAAVNGMTALSIARVHGHGAVVALLERA
jgi:ankyrin repeat protein